ncbi:MAG: hypothetical protein GX908_11110 [Gammaproteobacteria bacterium]|nr:hypothetical protein [Gammaproteobacteria bacterium]
MAPRQLINSVALGSRNRPVFKTKSITLLGVVPLNTLLGLNGDSREWLFLNKGTHEENDRAEFDPHIVETIVSTLEDLDAALS